MEKYIYYINGKFIPSHEAKVSFDDGGFQRGNAIFETIRFNKNLLFIIDSHLKRLRDGLDYFGFIFNNGPEIASNPVAKTITSHSIEKFFVIIFLSLILIIGLD